MQIIVSETSQGLGRKAAAYVADELRSAIAQKGMARIVLSTGASQFDTLAALVEEDVNWNAVEMFHLDEYIGLPVTHAASFRKYLQERFVSRVSLKAAYFVNGEGDAPAFIRSLSAKIQEAPIDISLIGIGENAHIAFNDPPADFDVTDPYIIVSLDEACKMQQVGEGWFATPSDVPAQAISMSVHQIMASERIVSCVPNARKANAIKLMLENGETNMIPATRLKAHPCVKLFLDAESAAHLSPELLSQYA